MVSLQVESGRFNQAPVLRRCCGAAERMEAWMEAMAEGAVIMRAKANSAMRQDRYQELKRILEERRLEIIGELQHKMRDVRDEHAAASRQNVRDEAETCGADIQDDIEFAVLQMKAETLEKVETALAHLDEGRYGYCYECGEEIPERRLRALPFAVRCTSCEEVREMARQRERVLAGRRAAPSLFADVVG
jgi:DnaK suppressor protein